MFESVANLIENAWQPKWDLQEERQYRDDLMSFLNNHLKKTHTIKPEDGRALADIGIDDEIAIELKLNLKGKSKVDRLLGQVVRYLKGKKSYDGVIIVLLDKENSPDVINMNVRDIRKYVQELMPYEKPDPILGSFRKVQSKKIKIITKSPGQVTKSRTNNNYDNNSLISQARRLDEKLGW
ncbi:MAG: hypothetical protein JRN37_09925 [Nitrososphaerota archaeon]|nr:hypothetical protein [Nitrososphaerota archaeon]MDG7039447.1 hypothetical protein [Nitrososphaerota archaeon]